MIDNLNISNNLLILNLAKFFPFKELIDSGLETVFSEFASIPDYSEKKFELKFGKIIFDEPKLSSQEARENHLTYEAPMKVRATLINKTLGTEK